MAVVSIHELLRSRVLGNRLLKLAILNVNEAQALPIGLVSENEPSRQLVNRDNPSLYLDVRCFFSRGSKPLVLRNNHTVFLRLFLTQKSD